MGMAAKLPLIIRIAAVLTLSAAVPFPGAREAAAGTAPRLGIIFLLIVAVIVAPAVPVFPGKFFKLAFYRVICDFFIFKVFLDLFHFSCSPALLGIQPAAAPMPSVKGISIAVTAESFLFSLAGIGHTDIACSSVPAGASVIPVTAAMRLQTDAARFIFPAALLFQSLIDSVKRHMAAVACGPGPDRIGSRKHRRLEKERHHRLCGRKGCPVRIRPCILL